MKVSINPAGFNHDIAAAELPADVWNFGANVLFNNGFPTAAPGWREGTTEPLGLPLYLLSVFTGPAYFWMYCGNTPDETAGFIAVTDGETHFDITPAGGIPATESDDWTGGILNGVPVLNYGKGDPVFWSVDTAQVCEPLPGWPAGTTCKALRPFKYHLIAMNIDDTEGQFPDLVLWSSAADPGNIPSEWVPTPENEAGSFTVSTTSGGIVDGGEMRDQFMVYKSGSSTVMQYIAGQFVFSNRKAFVTSGILARNCWAEMYGQHYVVTDGDVIRHNGQEVISLIDGTNREYLFQQLDPDYFRSTHVVLSHSNKQLWINWPKSGHEFCDTALVLDLISSKWGLIDYDEEVAFMARGILNNPSSSNAFDDRTDEFDQAPDQYNSSRYNPTSDVLVWCEYAQAAFLVIEGWTRRLQPVPVLLQLLSKDFGEAQTMKTITGVTVAGNKNVQNEQSLRVRIGTQLNLADSIQWTAAQPLEQYQRANFMASGRYISLEFTAQQTEEWELIHTNIDYQLQGQW